MPVNVHCTHCGQALQVLEEHTGKQVRCPKCYQVFVASPVAAGGPSLVIQDAPAAPAGPAAASFEAAAAPSPAPAGGPAKFCPHCGQTLPVAAGYCPACGKAPAAPGDGVAAPSFVPVSYGAPPRNNGLAIASLVLAIASWACLGPLTGIPAIICGHIARGQVRASGGTQTGEGMALAGLVIGYVNLLLYCGYFGLFILAGSSGGKFP